MQGLCLHSFVMNQQVLSIPASRSARYRRKGVQGVEALAMLLPTLLLYAALLVLPLLIVAPLAFDRPQLGQLVVRWDGSLINFERLLASPLYATALANSIGLSIAATLLTLLVGFPLAWQLARVQSARRINVLILLVLAAAQVDVVLRLFGMVALLGDEGTVNRLLRASGVLEGGLPLMYNRLGVVLGLVQLCTPFMVLSLLGALRRLDPAIIECARSLGAGTATVLWRIVLPWVRGHLLGASLLVFGVSMSAYVVPAMLAGGRVPMLANLLYEQIMGVGNWQFGAALALLLFVTACLVVGANQYLTREARA